MKAKYSYDADQVRNHAKGAWLQILERLAPELGDAIDRAPRHVDCPFPGHGGAKDFRLFRDAAETGGGVCTCGTSHDGFELLMKLYGWSFADTLKEVGDLIGAPKKVFERREKKARVNGKPAQEVTALPENLGKPVRTAAGKLVDFGTAPYNFDKKNSQSFFVKLERRDGAIHTVWGVELEPAMKAAKAEVGHVVVFKNYGRQPVVIVEQPRSKGDEPREREVYKNIWRCENRTAPVEEETDEVEADDFEDAVELNNEQKPARARTKPASNPDWVAEAKANAAKREERNKRRDERVQQNHADTWNQCVSTEADMASPLHRYLHGRGINITLTRKAYLSPENVRFAVSTPYHEENEENRYEKIGDFPALVCAVRAPNGDIMTLHRTYLTGNGEKAPVENARKMMPVPASVKLAGSAIRLGEPQAGYLGVAEGFETALAATQGTGIPCWSTVSAGLLAQFEPPKDVHTVVVFADKDRSRTGEVAAAQLQARLEAEGVRVIVMLPPQAIPTNAKSIDWNDVLQEHGLLGFPDRRRIDRMLKSA